MRDASVIFPLRRQRSFTPSASSLSHRISRHDRSPAYNSKSSRATAVSLVVKPTLLIVGAQKGGVGKTTVARLLLHWLEEKSTHPRRV